ncbi:MAG: tetratricopeptide repeat protein [Megamonas funiformis]|uniref:tetratricopeptide repeat protein n=1 Tax=Megamonas funiformis TaxID=437897 RepID=UPI0039933B98
MILLPNILYEAIPYQSYKLINNKEILPFEKVWIVNYINPDFTPAYIVRGDAYFTNKDYIEALQDYTTAIEQQPNNAEIYYKRGLTYNYLKDFYPTAINDFKQATDLNNNIANFWAEYSYALKFSHYGADEMLAKAIAINPQYKNFNHTEQEVSYL